MDSLEELIFADVDLWDLADSRLKFIVSELTISIDIHLAESLSESSDLVLWNS